MLVAVIHGSSRPDVPQTQSAPSYIPFRIISCIYKLSGQIHLFNWNFRMCQVQGQTYELLEESLCIRWGGEAKAGDFIRWQAVVIASGGGGASSVKKDRERTSMMHWIFLFHLSFYSSFIFLLIFFFCLEAKLWDPIFTYFNYCNKKVWMMNLSD